MHTVLNKRNELSRRGFVGIMAMVAVSIVATGLVENGDIAESEEPPRTIEQVIRAAN